MYCIFWGIILTFETKEKNTEFYCYALCDVFKIESLKIKHKNRNFHIESCPRNDFFVYY